MKLDALKSKAERKAKNTMNLFISISGFTSGALDAYRERTPLIILDGGDLYCVLDQRVRLDDLLKRKKWHVSETGSCYFPACEMIAEQ